jgi:transcriptional/translational regulatory protein YebC/TACO1
LTPAPRRIGPRIEYVEVYTAPGDLESVRKALEEQGIEVQSAEVRRVAKTTASLDEHAALQVLKLMDKLEEMDDVQNVDSNVDFSSEIIEKYESQSR